MTTESSIKVDHAAIKTNQLVIISLGILAFVINSPALAASVATILGIGTVLKSPAFGFVYQFLLKPRGWMKPDILDDHPEPHLFSQFMGFLFLTAGSVSLFLGGAVLGWSLVWVVIALASLNAFGGFCTGCAIYYWLARFKVPGFNKLPQRGLVPGVKPKGGTPA